MRRRILQNANRGVSVIHIDQNNPDPFTRVTGDINGSAIQWIRNNSHRVLAVNVGDERAVYCRLSDTDGTKYHDGTSADLTGMEGDVFVKLPKFYYKGTEGDQVDIIFSTKRIDDEQIEWDGNILIGAYEAVLDIATARSISGAESAGSASQEDFKQYARYHGTGYQLVDWQMHCVLGCLYYAMYGNTNCQATVGSGTGSYTKPTGQTDYLGMQDTQASTNGDSQSVNFWGLENWWGNKYEWIDDYINPANTLTATVNDPVTGGTRNLPFQYFNGRYVKKMKFGKYLDLVNTGQDSDRGTSSTYYCDHQYWPEDTLSSPRNMWRSSNYSYTDGGVAYADANRAPLNLNTYAGSRLAFRGICQEIENPDDYKWRLLSIWSTLT